MQDAEPLDTVRQTSSSSTSTDIGDLVARSVPAADLGDLRSPGSVGGIRDAGMIGWQLQWGVRRS